QPEPLEAEVPKDDHDEEEQHEDDMQEAQLEEEGQTWHEPFQNPFKGQTELEELPEGPYDKSVLSEYGGHIARCVKNGNKLYKLGGILTNEEWWAYVGYFFILPIEGRLLDHDGILSKVEAMELNLLGQDGYEDSMHMCRGYAVRTYLFLVDTAIFSSKAKNYVDVAFLKYFRDLWMIDTYVWGPAALTFMYRELTNVIVPMCKYLAGHGSDAATRCKLMCYERVLHQFGYVQTIPRPTHRSTPTTTPQQIDHQYTQFLDWVLPPNMLGKHALYQPTELDAIGQQEAATEGERTFDLVASLRHIREITQELMVNGNIPHDYHPYIALQEIERETMTYIFQRRGRGVQIL
ncbi:serine/threonine-protein phosphatase 7 long form-like protein, partial [Trifolium medium]|nr:serine/threonine-protein phosphatase 7 long form-like protein [Trifolium medium]